MDSPLSESTPSETTPTLLPEGSLSFQLSPQMIINTILIVLGIPFNVLAIFFLWKKEDGSLSHIVPFLLNLAAADLLVLTVFVPVFIAYEAMNFEWPFGSFVCKGVFSLTHICMYASLATLAAIAVERYYITFLYSIRKKTVKYVIIAIWVVAILLSIPQLTLLSTVNINSLEDLEFEEDEFSLVDGEGLDEGKAKYVCDIVWPHPNFEKVLQPIDAVVLYLVPLAFIVVVYVKIIVKLRAIDSKQLPPARRCFVKQRRRAIRKMITMIAIFALCHLPIHVFHLLRVFFFEFWEVLVTNYPCLFSLSVNLVLVTHVLNPLAYGSLHRCFVCCVEFLRFLNCCYLFNNANGTPRYPHLRKSNTQQTILRPIRVGSP